MFLSVLSLVTPVFALMGLGYAAMKLKWLPEGGHQALAQFGFKIAIPAMLFKAMLGAGPLAGSPINLLSAYLLPVAMIWLLMSVLGSMLLKRPAEDLAGLSMASTFGNTVMLGIPISLMAFGEGAATPLAILISAEAVLLWIVATLQIEFARRGSAVSMAALGSVFKDLITNTIILSLVLGMAGRAVGFTMPGPVDRVVGLLGQAGVPVALFALGMALANFRIAGEKVVLGVLAVLKLAALPLLAFVVAHHIFRLPAVWTAVLTLHAAMPVGANAFIFAMRYDRGAATVSAAIALSTLIAILSVTGVIVALKGILGL
jgi:malonate transporter and related proteins